MRKYVKNFVKIAAPITYLLKDKFERITLTDDCHANFEAFKKVVTKVPVLRIINTLKCGMVLCTNANDMARCAILIQVRHDVIVYESRKLSNAKLNYPIHEKELLTILYALKI